MEIFLPVRTETAAPVATTMDVAAISPHRILFTLPSFAAWSLKKGELTVNHDGQNPANTPEASPMRRMMMVMSSAASVVAMIDSY